MDQQRLEREKLCHLLEEVLACLGLRHEGEQLVIKERERSPKRRAIVVEQDAILAGHMRDLL